MAIEKQFDEEMGYAASRELPPAVAQYMKATGKSEEQVAKEIINEDPEWLDWTTHTKHPGNSTPEDNGWTDLKKLGLGIGRSVSDSWMNHRNNTDPMWRVGLINAIFGDPSMLGQYYQMQNQNAENEKNRQAQMAYNSQIKAVEDASAEALKNAQAEKTFRDTVAGLQDTGKELSNREKNMVMTAYNELSDTAKAKYSKTMQDLGLVEVDEAESETSADKPRYETEIKQKYTKDDVENIKTKIKMMPNGAEKKQKAEELNQLILDNQSKVEGGLGDGFSPEELKNFGTVAPKKPKKGEIIDATTFKQWRDKIKVKAAGKDKYEVL